MHLLPAGLLARALHDDDRVDLPAPACRPDLCMKISREAVATLNV